MKWLLAISLLLNGYLVFRLTEVEPKVVTQEKVVIKKSQPKVIERKVYVEVPAPEKKESNANSASAMTSVEFDEKDMEDLVSKVSQDRDDFLTGELGLTPQDLSKLRKVKEEFSQRYQQILPADHVGDLTIEQRRQLLELDVEREREFARVVGENKWKKFQSFKDEYNRKMFSKQVNEKGMIIPMEI
jgi:hypothetical protein